MMNPAADLRIDVAFPLTGTTLPLDHGYPLFAALCHRVAALHAAPWLAIHPLRGTVDRGLLTLAKGEDACLRLRVPPAHLATLLPLSQCSLQIKGHALHLGEPQLQLLLPAPALAARMVIIKGFLEETPFRHAVLRQLDALHIHGDLQIGPRRVALIGDHHVVGFAVRLSRLSEDASLLLQYRGLGGRQRMGCGLFLPAPAL